jgi:tRNA (cmo5U34)-methyltransferase
MNKTSNDKVKDHFEAEAKQFDDTISKIIPYYDQMINALVDAIHFEKDSEISVIDLGCGTGTVAAKISEKFRNSRICCLDIATNMIDIARQKLTDHKDVEFITGDFSTITFDNKFDVVVSSLALHHLENDHDKKEFYKKVYNSLTDSGVFINADVVLASSDYFQIINMIRWIDYMNKNITCEEIFNNWIPKYKTEDRPAKLMEQLKWLEEIGFKSVDVYWKYYNFSVYGGSK